MPIQENKALAASSFTFNPVQLYSLVIGGTDKISSYPLLIQCKLALTAINILLLFKIIGAPKKFKKPAAFCQFLSKFF
jgi:hypothetical protein